MSVSKTARVGIVGAGRGGSALLNLFKDMPHVTIAVVMDVDPDAPGLRLARSQRIPTETELPKVFDYALDVVIEVTGQPEVQSELLRLKPPHAEIIGAAGVRLMWEAVEKTQQTLRELTSTQDQLVRSERLTALGEMASGIAHDFNNRLAVILGRTQLLLHRADDPELRRGLRVIERTALESAETVRRVLEFTRRRRDQPFAPVNVASLIEDVVEGSRGKWKDEAQAQGATILLETELEPVPPVLGQAMELREALTNLIFNAVEAMPSGGRIVLKTRLAGDLVEITVEDAGIGMSEATLARAFEPFFTTKGPQGTGLGLSVAYGIISRHGGQIRATSQEGRGTTIKILLQVAPQAPGPDVVSPAVPRLVALARILVIDDEAEVRAALTEMLATHGHQVTAAPSGSEGLALLERGQFDLVFTDLGMPGITGWDVARQVKALRPGTPVVLVTGWGVAIDPEQQRESGVDLVLLKPFQMEELFAVVQALARTPATGDWKAHPGVATQMPGCSPGRTG